MSIQTTPSGQTANNGATLTKPATQPNLHPRRDEHGKPVHLKTPSLPTSAESWTSANDIATVVPGGQMPPNINGIPLTPWRDPPGTPQEWNADEGLMPDLIEPPLHGTAGKVSSSGVVIEESDGRVWLIAPSNAFGGYKATFPKGKSEPALTLQANAIKEAFEESGLHVAITGFLGDYARTTSVVRLYLARRTGGTPAEMGWESQAVHLVPRARLYELLNSPMDDGPAESLGAGKRPSKSS